MKYQNWSKHLRLVLPSVVALVVLALPLGVWAWVFDPALRKSVDVALWPATPTCLHWLAPWISGAGAIGAANLVIGGFGGAWQRYLTRPTTAIRLSIAAVAVWALVYVALWQAARLA